MPKKSAPKTTKTKAPKKGSSKKVVEPVVETPVVETPVEPTEQEENYNGEFTEIQEDLKSALALIKALGSKVSSLEKRVARDRKIMNKKMKNQIGKKKLKGNLVKKKMRMIKKEKKSRKKGKVSCGFKIFKKLK